MMPARSPSSLHVALLEPYYGGSHAAFVDTLVKHSRHRFTLATMPPRKWKWRMRGAALWFTQEDTAWMSAGPIDRILCNDMLSVADLRATLPDALKAVPTVCYFHENQLSYPIPNEQDRDYQYGMTNLTSCLAADAVWFNSRFHLEDFLSAAEGLLRKMPDCVPGGLVDRVRAIASVVTPPVEVPVAPPGRVRVAGPLTILWCHRWEYDKNPEPFFDALIRLDRAGVPFRVVLLGEQFRTAPRVFGEAWSSLSKHIVHTGFLPGRADYQAMLASCDLVVSTAIQENFGIGIIEAILAGCQPLVPNRLAYPETIPSAFHATCLFENDVALHDALAAVLRGDRRLSQTQRTALRDEIEATYGAPAATRRIDELLVET